MEADEKEQTVTDSKLVPLKSMKSSLFQVNRLINKEIAQWVHNEGSIQ